MAREHPEVRLNRRTFSGAWEVVRVANDGRTIVDRWPLHADDAALLEAMFQDGREIEAQP